MHGENDYEGMEQECQSLLGYCICCDYAHKEHVVNQIVFGVLLKLMIYK